MIGFEGWLKIKTTKPASFRRITSVEVTKKKPTIKVGDIAIKLDIQVPESLFEIPTLSANIKIPDSIPKDAYIAQVGQDVSDFIKRNNGIELKILTGEN